MTLLPLDFPCPHLATPQERERDPEYGACQAQAGAPCTWARRHDGLPNPAFHSERLESAGARCLPEQDLDSARFREVVLESGLV